MPRQSAMHTKTVSGMADQMISGMKPVRPKMKRRAVRRKAAQKSNMAPQASGGRY